MASRANNKYASLNFNDIYEKKFINNSNSSSNNNNNKKQNPISSSSSLNSPSKTILSNSRIHGNMLVLSRASPKPISQPSPPPSPAPLPQPQQTRSEPDPISLRPLGRTGSASPLSPSPLTSPKEFVPSLYPSPSAKKDKFVPPHLRPGFVRREEKPDLGDQRYGEDGRPKSGGGYERMRRGGGGESDLVEMNRPGSSGTRPSSSGY